MHARRLRHRLGRRWLALVAVLGLIGVVATARPAAAAPRNFPVGSLVIPMDLAYQDRGLLQAYGLVFQLLRQNVPVAWTIEPTKIWHPAPCNTVGDLCPWDCAIIGSGVKCPYPTASPDFTVTAQVLWDPMVAAGTVIAGHGYRGGPFVIDAADRARAMAIIDAWNDRALWPANPWAQRTVFQVVTVHVTTAPFAATVARDLRAAPTVAVLVDGSETLATATLRAAGIPQSNGHEFPVGPCAAGACGPGTDEPDLLPLAVVMGDLGQCGGPNRDHKNGGLFAGGGVPAYCQVASMGWQRSDRERVECGGGACPATPNQCSGQAITYEGHEAIAELREFLRYPVSFFAQGEAVIAFENSMPETEWPYIDDEARDGHLLTTTGAPPACPCDDAGYACVTGGCAGADCCLPRDNKELGAGFELGVRPATVEVVRPAAPDGQVDGAFVAAAGAVPSFDLSVPLVSGFQQARSPVLLTSAAGPGKGDVWMTGYLDGACPADQVPCDAGRINYLGGDAYAVATPVSASPATQGARLFLDAMFAADCVTSVGQPALTLALDGPTPLGSATVPATGGFGAGFANAGRGAALDAVLTLQVGAGVTIVDATGGTVAGDTATWTIAAIGGVPGVPGDPPAMASRPANLRFADYGTYPVTLAMRYRVGLTTVSAPLATAMIEVVPAAVVDAGVDSGIDAGVGGDGGGGCCGASTGGQSGSVVFVLGLALAVLGLLGRRRRAA